MSRCTDEQALDVITDSRVGMLVHRYFSNPRLILFSFGVLMTVITIASSLSEPNYLVWPRLYMVAGTVGAISSFVAMIRPNKWSLALSGAIIAGSVTSRGTGLLLTVLTGPWRGDISWTFLVGAVAYFVILTMLPPVWFRYLIPWTVEKVR